MEIRPAETKDADAIGAVHRAAFPEPAEAELVATIVREGEAVVSLVADEDGTVIGHVLLSRMRVKGDGRAYRAVALGPIAILPEQQGKGIGSALIESALGVARTTGEYLVFVIGEPAFYGRFGFAAATALPFESDYSGPYFMALALQSGLALPRSGRADYARAFADLP